jgi:ribonuclease HII
MAAGIKDGKGTGVRWIGIDEVGYGSFFGPVTVAACYLGCEVKLPEHTYIIDSKVLTESKRRFASAWLTSLAADTPQECVFAIEDRDASVINEKGITFAIRDAMTVAGTRVAKELLAVDPNTPIQLMVDGKYVPKGLVDFAKHTHVSARPSGNASDQLSARPPGNASDQSGGAAAVLEPKSVIEGDGLYRCIAAASILAKVHRDRQLVDDFHSLYPLYDLASNKGYGSASHRAAHETRRNTTPSCSVL